MMNLKEKKKEVENFYETFKFNGTKKKNIFRVPLPDFGARSLVDRKFQMEGISFYHSENEL